MIQFQRRGLDLSFTGQDQHTVSGMHDFLDRRFIAVQGRWLSPDPVGLAAVDPSNPQSWNRYSYVTNNPLAMFDPLGDDACYTAGRQTPCQGPPQPPSSFDASNGARPTIGPPSIGDFFNQGHDGGGLAFNSGSLPTGLSNRSGDPGYHGGGELLSDPSWYLDEVNKVDCNWKWDCTNISWDLHRYIVENRGPHNGPLQSAYLDWSLISQSVNAAPVLTHEPDQCALQAASLWATWAATLTNYLKKNAGPPPAALLITPKTCGG